MPRKQKPKGGTIYLLFKSTESPTPAVLYKFKIGDSMLPQEEDLEEVATFYNGRVTEVVGVSLGIGKFFIVANEFNQYIDEPWDGFRIPPYILTLGAKQAADDNNNNNNNNNNNTTVKLPQGPKADPFACLVRNKVYVLSRRTVVQEELPEPSFEAYDLQTDSWESLEPPPFNEKIPTTNNENPGFGMCTTGFAVYKHFIIVCGWNMSRLPEHFIHSYDTLSNKWKPVRFDHLEILPHDDDFKYNCVHDDDVNNDAAREEAELRIWDREAVVFGNVIYSYTDISKELVSCTCTMFEDGPEYDLSLGKLILVDAWKPHIWTHIEIYGEKDFEKSVAIGKLKDDMFYVVTTLATCSPKSDDLQPVHVTIFRTCKQKLQGEERSCHLVSEFPLYMPRGEYFDLAKISSCLMLQPDCGL